MRPSGADAVAIVVLLAVAYLSERVGTPRVQPVDISDPSVRHLRLPDIVPSSALFLGAFALPPLYMGALYALPLGGGDGGGSTPSGTGAAFFRGLGGGAALTLFAGLLEANAVTLTLTNVLKLLVGAPRPFFAAACGGYLDAGGAPSNATVGTRCAGAAGAVADARKSFPSGHSALAFSAATYTAALAMRRVALASAATRSKTARLLAVWAPLVVAALVAASRLVDYHHHYADVVAGTVLGAASGAIAAAARGHAVVPAGGEAAAAAAAEKDGDEDAGALLPLTGSRTSVAG